MKKLSLTFAVACLAWKCTIKTALKLIVLKALKNDKIWYTVPNLDGTCIRQNKPVLEIRT